MKNGFTLAELIVVLVILLSLAALIGGGIRSCSNSDFTQDQLYYPDATRARAEEVESEELRRANDLKERELDLREAELRKVER